MVASGFADVMVAGGVGTAPVYPIAREMKEAGCRVVDFSADYRLDNPDVFSQWYGQKHADPERLGKVVYGPAKRVV